MTEWQVGDGEAGERLDHFLSERANCSRGAARRLVESEAVRVNGRRGKKGLLLREGDRVTVEGALPDRAALSPRPEPDAPLAVLHEDARLLIVAKPAGIPSHPLRTGERGTLAGALVARFPECAQVGRDPREAGLAHRLDIDTSGALCAARDDAAWEHLRRAFHAGEVEKRYLALVDGAIDDPGGCDLPLAHDPGDRRRMIACAEPARADRLAARPAATRWRPLAVALGRTLVEVEMLTGRMHQVRAHLAHAGHPLVGDALYGGPPALDGTRGHLLHADHLGLPHPDGHRVAASAPLPPDRAAALAPWLAARR